MAYEQGLYDCCVNPGNAWFSTLCCPCAFGELYARRRSQERCAHNACLGTCFACIPLVNCFFLAKERQGVQADDRLEDVQLMGKIWCMAFCLWGCLLSQDRYQYDSSVGEPRLLFF
ncbi:hypothetical protein FVE85_8617 [Porphyridium purpureum]|uniref:PLAC8 family protein n=1 Tax=Porphyridium purpureum TaxID=35688 RepID=A0A5J4YQV7_PORPP|nr:hypothetical protein FVE85_8617 [Porphyridium purpureum]|eukprot:POR2809..scf296_7